MLIVAHVCVSFDLNQLIHDTNDQFSNVSSMRRAAFALSSSGQLSSQHSGSASNANCTASGANCLRCSVVVGQNRLRHRHHLYPIVAQLHLHEQLVDKPLPKLNIVTNAHLESRRQGFEQHLLIRSSFGCIMCVAIPGCE